MPRDGWYGPAIDDWANNDAGDHRGPVTIGLLHTTESPVGRYRSGGPNNYGNFGHTSFPHFTVDEQGGQFRCWQHISIRRSAKALRNLSGGVVTNTEGVIQIEVVGSAAKPFTDRPVLVAGLRELMRWIESQTEIPRRSTVTWRRYPDSYGASPVRLGSASWRAYAGWLGHQHAPENLHGDPGIIDIAALLDSPPTLEDPVAMTNADKDEMKAHVNQVVAPLVQAIDHLKAELDMLRRDNRDFAVAIGSIQSKVGVEGEPLKPSALHSLDGVIES